MIWRQAMGRYTPFLKYADLLLTADLDTDALRNLCQKLGSEWRGHLSSLVLDIFQTLPFANTSIDTILCTGLLYLYPYHKLSQLFAELSRIIHITGCLIFDFATEIERRWPNDQPVIVPDEIKYRFEEGQQTIQRLLSENGFEVEAITISTIDESVAAGYRIRNRKLNVLVFKR